MIPDVGTPGFGATRKSFRRRPADASLLQEAWLWLGGRSRDELLELAGEADLAVMVCAHLVPDKDVLLVRMGLPGAADDLARIVHAKVKPPRLSLPLLAEECPEWVWYEES